MIEPGYYSQFGEDKFLVEYLLTRRIMVEPLIVDVGAGDGKFISNSRYILEHFPYKALLIEPSGAPFRDAEKLYKKNKNVTVIQTAVAGRPFQYKVYHKLRSHWSLDEVRKSNAKNAQYTQTLTEIFKEQGIEKVGILSLDTEGFETGILAEMLTNSTVRPEIIIVEAQDEADAYEQESILTLEYRKIKTMGVNQIFILRTSDK
jgi:FkbM family methyltransferase